MSTCHACVSSAAHSLIHLDHVRGSLRIKSMAGACTRKTSGGDVWVVRVSSPQSTYRVIAKHAGNGTYHAELHPLDEEHVRVHTELWTSSGSDSDHGSWSSSGLDDVFMWGRQGGDVASLCVNSPTLEQPSCKPPSTAHRVCRPLSNASANRCIAVEASNRTLPRRRGRMAPQPSSRCDSTASGRWVTAAACQDKLSGLCDPEEAAAAALDQTRRVWVPFGCRPPKPARSCNAPGALLRCVQRKRLIFLGDSVSRGNYLDLCVRLGVGVANSTCYTLDPFALESANPPERLPSGAAVIFAPIFGDHTYRGHRGLVNLVGNRTIRAAWERLLSADQQRETVVVAGSGLHDVTIHAKLPGVDGSGVVGSHVDALPLARYRRHLCAVAQLMQRVRAANPTISFAWRQTTHATLTGDGSRSLASKLRRTKDWAIDKDMGGDACQQRGWVPATNVPLVQSLNAIANDTFSRVGIPVWHEPPLLTLSAPSQAFSDAIHHDACTLASARTKQKLHPKKYLADCEAARRRGLVFHSTRAEAEANWALERANSRWSETGGLSEAITSRLLQFLFPHGDVQ